MPSNVQLNQPTLCVHIFRYIHEPNEEVFELSRVDAVSLDVLTRSPFTINIFGYCGSSSIQEFAGGDLKGLLPKLDPLEKLRMAAWIAEGVADIHSVDDSLDRNNVVANNHTVDGNSTIFRKRNATQVPSLIHNDINMDNILLGHRNGVDVPLLNDFNIAVFRKKNVHNGEPCRFRGRFANPQVSVRIKLLIFPFLLGSLLTSCLPISCLWCQFVAVDVSRTARTFRG